MVRIGILDLQGNVREHHAMLQLLDNVQPHLVRRAGEVRGLDGLIIPGGESTTIGKLMARYGIDEAIQEQTQQGMGVFGTCAGMILLAKEIIGSEQTRLGLMDITVQRNAFGRQQESFETHLTIGEIGAPDLPVAFIRAPVAITADTNVNILARIPQGIVLAQQGPHLAAAFHAEQLGDPRLHRLFAQGLNKK